MHIGLQLWCLKFKQGVTWIESDNAISCPAFGLQETAIVLSEKVSRELNWECDKTDQGKQRKKKEERNVGISANLVSTFYSTVQQMV